MVTLARPASAREAERLKQALGATATYVAGGTALQLAWGLAAAPEVTLVAVDALPEAQGVVATADGLRIGAGVRLETLRCDPMVRQHAALLATACDSLAALGVRHLATLGGNVGWRWGDTLPALLALDARAEQGDGTMQPLDAWLALAEQPLLVALHVPASSASDGWFEKVGLRAAFSPTRLALAVHGTRVAASAAGWSARRLRQVEQALAAADGAPGRDALQAACNSDIADPAIARLAARLLHGRLGAAST